MYILSIMLLLCLCTCQQMFVLLIETIQACVLCLRAQIPAGLSVTADAYRPVPTEMDEMPAPPPNYSEM